MKRGLALGSILIVIVLWGSPREGARARNLAAPTPIPGTSAPVFALSADASGELIVGGGFYEAGGADSRYIARWDGTAWSPLGTNLNSAVLAVSSTADGEVVAGGIFSHTAGTPLEFVGQWAYNAWTGLTTAVNGRVQAVARGPNGVIYIGGAFTSAGGADTAYIAQWDGANWVSIGTLNGPVYALTFDAGGVLYAGGDFTEADGVPVNHIAAWNGGIGWAALGDGVNNTVRALAVRSDGVVYAGGDFTQANGEETTYVAQWDGTAWSRLGSVSYPGVNDRVSALTLGPSGELYVGGRFTHAGGLVVNHIAYWNGTGWSRVGPTWNPGVNDSVYALTFGADGALYAGGAFTQATNQYMGYIAKWDGTNWSALANH